MGGAVSRVPDLGHLPEYTIKSIDIVHTYIIRFPMHFEWDPRKNEHNVRKHRFSFEEAQEVFDDPFHLSVLDRRFTYFEERWITVGQTDRRRIVVTAHVYFDDEDDEVIRIISAREATAHERRQYEEHA